MNQVGQAGAGRSPSRRTFSKLGSVSSRLVAAGALVLGLGALPVGGLAAASASPVQRGDHGFGFGHGRTVRHARSVTGEVTTAPSGNEFPIVTAGGTTFDVYVDVSPTTTTYTEPGVPNGTTVGLTSIAVGDNVEVRGSMPSSGTIDASSVKIPEATASGTVQSLPAGEITLSPATSSLTSTSVTIIVDVSSASFTDPGITGATISNVVVGDNVKVKGLQMGDQSGTLTVDATSVNIPRVTYEGSIGNLSSSGFTLTSTSSTVTVTVDVSPDASSVTTKYRVPGVSSSSATISNLSNGEYAEVTGNQYGADTVLATLVEVVNNRHGHGRGHGGGSSSGGGPGSGGNGHGRPGSGNGQGGVPGGGGSWSGGGSSGGNSGSSGGNSGAPGGRGGNGYGGRGGSGSGGFGAGGHGRR